MARPDQCRQLHRAELVAILTRALHHRIATPSPLLSIPSPSSPSSSPRDASPSTRSPAEISQCVEKAEAAKKGKNRATVVTLNAEIRRAKAKLLEEDLPKLQHRTLPAPARERDLPRQIHRRLAPPSSSTSRSGGR